MYSIFETFVGAGGSHLGFKKCGFTSRYVNDISENCIKTLLYNNPEIKDSAFVDLKSILDINPEEILERTKMKAGEPDVLFGGVVCKGFSMAGERSPNDERNYFYHKQLDLVKVLRPKISIIENVPGILNAEVISTSTPIELKNEVDKIWSLLESHKGRKAQLRKENKITKEFEDEGKQLRKEKEKLLKKLKNEGFLISVINDIYSIYSELGYRVNYKILNSAWFGAATKRERIIIVAVRNDIKEEFIFPKPEYADSSIRTKIEEKNDNIKYKKPKTVFDALQQIDYSDKTDIDNIPMNHQKKTVDRFKLIPPGKSIADFVDDLPSDLKISKFYSRGSTMRLDGNSCAPTLVPGHSNFPVHPIEHRSITVREAATITGFPLKYKFFGNHTQRCEQVGNAVPPPLSYALAKSCKQLLDKYYNNINTK